MALKRHERLKWHSREVLEGSGQISELRQEIPRFAMPMPPFRVEGGGVNKYLYLIVREPLKENQDYLLPSDDDEVQIPVATVSEQYELVQHRRIVKALETALKQIDFNPEHLEAELTLTEYGEHMRVSFTLPNYKFDPGDGGETVLLRVNALNSVDKTTALEINLTWCSVSFRTGMLVRRDARLKKKRRKSHIPLECVIKKFLERQLHQASGDIRRLQQWQLMKVSCEELSEAKPSPGQIEHWLDKAVAKRWGVHAAAKAYHIAKTGYDAKFVNRSKKKKVKFNQLDLEFQYRDPVRGSFAPVRNAYDISQVLSWLASQQGTIQDQLDRMMDIPYLMHTLLKEEKPLTLSM